MTTGLTSAEQVTLNSTPAGDSALQSHLCAIDPLRPPPGAVEPAIGIGNDKATDTDTDINTNTNKDKACGANDRTDPVSSLNSWRSEVAARLERYRIRRKPRSPRYPSLLLPFDTPASWSRPAPAKLAEPASAELRSSSFDSAEHSPTEGIIFHTQETVGAQSRTETSHLAPEQNSRQYFEPALEPSAKIIAFPRSAAIPVFRASELADPIFDQHRPRIVEAPEILPPPPAMGGITIEPAVKEPADSRAGADFPSASPTASIAHRALAALVDTAVLAAALATFTTIFLRLNPALNPGLNLGMNLGLNNPGLNLFHLFHKPLPLLAGVVGMIAVLFWAAYEFLFVVYTGSTPGLRAARLRLATFDGSPLTRRSRRFRVLASFLSAFSAGLGYLWCILDQHGLCWHDRISRTHVQSAVPPK